MTARRFLTTAVIKTGSLKMMERLPHPTIDPARNAYTPDRSSNSLNNSSFCGHVKRILQPPNLVGTRTIGNFRSNLLTRTSDNDH